MKTLLFKKIERRWYSILKNKKNNNSIIKKITLAVFFVSIIMIYINHVGSKNKTAKKTEPNQTELEQLLSFDALKDYPKTARDVVKLHCRYSKLLYGSKLSEEEMATLCWGMRKLYSSELLFYNPDNTAIDALKKDIEAMEEEGYSYKAYALPEVSQIKYYTQNGVEMASMEVTITLGAKKEAGYYYQQYVLVKENNLWKILAWGESKLAGEKIE